MSSIEQMGFLKTELENSIMDFQELLKESRDDEKDYDYSLEKYEERINIALTLQTKASYVTSIIFRLINMTKPLFKKTQVGTKNYNQVKSAFDELKEYMDIYKSHVYTFSSKAKSLVNMLHIKQMASPDCLRGQGD